jgi:hypothetical protein
MDSCGSCFIIQLICNKGVGAFFLGLTIRVFRSRGPIARIIEKFRALRPLTSISAAQGFDSARGSRYRSSIAATAAQPPATLLYRSLCDFGGLLMSDFLSPPVQCGVRYRTISFDSSAAKERTYIAGLTSEAKDRKDSVSKNQRKSPAPTYHVRTS